jgi:hypothetical protein
MTLIAIAAEAADKTDIWSVIIASLLGGGGMALGSRRFFAWAAKRKRVGAGKYGWKWGTWLAVVDLDDMEKKLERAREEVNKAREEAAMELERARAIQREAESRVAKAEALIKQCQEHTAAAIRERDVLALKMANGGER